MTLLRLGPRAARPHPPRSRPVRLLGGLLACAVAAACSPSGDGPGPGPDGKAPAGPIVVASGLDVTGSGGVRQQLVAEWNRQHANEPALQAKIVELPGGADQQRSQLLGALQSGSARYDVVNLDITWVPEFAAAGLIAPLSSAGSGDPDIIEQVNKTAVWKNDAYAKPFNTDVGLLYYRPDLLAQAGIDYARQPIAAWTWADLAASIDTLGKVTERGGVEAGWTTQLEQYEGLTVNTIEAFESVGVHLTDAAGHYTADPQTLRTGLLEIRSRTRGDRTLPHAASSDESASLIDFAAGRTAFLRHWPYAYGALPRQLPPTAEYGVNLLPGKAVLGGQNLAVTADSPQAAHARELIDFLTSAESERCLFDAGFAATRLSVYEGTARPCWPRVAAALRPRPASGSGSGSGAPSGSGEQVQQAKAVQSAAEYTRTLRAALTAAVQRPRTPYYGAFTQVLQSHIHAWLAADSPDADQAADNLDAALRDALDGR